MNVDRQVRSLTGLPAAGRSLGESRASPGGSIRLRKHCRATIRLDDSGNGIAFVALQGPVFAMLDRAVRRVIDPPLEVLAGRLAALGVSANGCSLAGFAVGMAGCVAIGSAQYGWGLACLLANRLADGLDGCIARRTRSTDVGGFLDFVLDVIFYGGVPMAFAVAQPDAVLAACFLVYSFMGTTSSFLAYAVISAKRGVTSDGDRRKSFFYSVGLMEGTETVLFFVAFCLLPDRFGMLAWVFGALCWATVGQRIVAGVLAFRDRRSSAGAGAAPHAASGEGVR